MVIRTACSLDVSQLAAGLSSTHDVHGLVDNDDNDDKIKPSTTTTTANNAKNVQPPSPFEGSYENFASSSGGARVLFATDEWFASADNLLKDGPPIFDDEAFCVEGKVMDGWESRRRREPGHDWCLIKLSHRAQIVGIEVDTAHFTGNNAPHISLEIADLNYSHDESTMASGIPDIVERMLHGGDRGTGHTPQDVQEAEESCRRVKWKPLLGMSPLQPGYEATRMHYFYLPSTMTGTHVRVNYFPDGGVARLKLWGNAAESALQRKKPLYSPICTGKLCTVVSHNDTTTTTTTLPSRLNYEYPEVSSCTNGGRSVDCSNKHYGDPSLLIQPSLGKDMGDGWETARHPERPAILKRDAKTNLVDSPLMDWAILQLGTTIVSGVARIILDTKHFRGNYPESVSVEGCYCRRSRHVVVVVEHEDDTLSTIQHAEWFTLIPRTRMAPDSEHVFDRSLQQIKHSSRAVTHVRIRIYPDGGLSRVRIYGN